MALKTKLNRDRYFWMTPSLSSGDDAIVTVEVTAPARPCTVTVEVVLGSAMLGIAPHRSPQSHRTPSGLTVDLGEFAPSEHRSFVLTVHPKPASRPGRRRVAVVRKFVDGNLSHSTTVWARVERFP